MYSFIVCKLLCILLNTEILKAIHETIDVSSLKNTNYASILVDLFSEIIKKKHNINTQENNICVVLSRFPLKYQSKNTPESGQASSNMLAFEAEIFLSP